MNKELEALENIKHYDSRVGLHESDYDIIEKALKVFDIFKSFKVDFYHSRHRDTGYELCITDYDGDSIYKEITKEVYDLLSEVFL